MTVIIVTALLLSFSLQILEGYRYPNRIDDGFFPGHEGRGCPYLRCPWMKYTRITSQGGDQRERVGEERPGNLSETLWDGEVDRQWASQPRLQRHLSEMLVSLGFLRPHFPQK